MQVEKEGPNAICRSIRGFSSSMQEFPGLLLARGCRRVGKMSGRPFIVNMLTGQKVLLVSRIGTRGPLPQADMGFRMETEENPG
jgi:hypothetical protein